MTLSSWAGEENHRHPGEMEKQRAETESTVWFQKRACDTDICLCNELWDTLGSVTGGILCRSNIHLPRPKGPCSQREGEVAGAVKDQLALALPAHSSAQKLNLLS